jgi:hypothetical protein
MTAVLPWATWLLLLASVGAGLAVVLVFWVRQRQPRASHADAPPPIVHREG